MAVAKGRELDDSYFQHQRVRAVSDRLRVYREDLADWFSQIFALEIQGSTFISEIGQRGLGDGGWRLETDGPL